MKKKYEKPLVEETDWKDIPSIVGIKTISLGKIKRDDGSYLEPYVFRFVLKDGTIFPPIDDDALNMIDKTEMQA